MNRLDFISYNTQIKYSIVSELGDEIVDEIYYTVKKLYEKNPYTSPQFISLNTEAYEALCVKLGGLLEKFQGHEIIYNPDQQERVKFLFGARTQYLREREQQ
jgi:hypothetical protein